MTDESIGTPVERLASLRETQRLLADEAQSRQEEMHVKLFSTRSNNVFGEPDYWFYQTCTEFAFYQTCEVGSKCMYTQGLVTLDDYLSTCQQTYNITPE